MIVINEDKMVKYLAILIAIWACTVRLATAVREFANGIIILLAILLWYQNRGKFSISTEAKGYIKAYAVFGACVVPSVLFSDNQWFSLKEFLSMWVWRYFIFIAIVAFIKRRDYLVNMLSAFLLVCGVDCLVSLVQVMQQVTPLARGKGFGGPVLTLASLICMLLPIAVVILVDPGFEKRLKKSAAFTTAGAVIGLVCNKSRGAWLTELIVIPGALFRYFKTNVKLLAVSVLVLVSILGIMAVDPVYQERVVSIANTTTDKSNADRIWAWRSSVKMIKDHPVTGVGLGRFGEHYLKKYRYKEESQGLGHAHNNFVQVAAENGIIGLIGLLFFIGYSLFISIRNYRKQPNPYDLLIFTTVLGYLCLFGLIDYSLRLPTIRIMWFLLAVLLKLKETENRTSLL